VLRAWRCITPHSQRHLLRLLLLSSKQPHGSLLGEGGGGGLVLTSSIAHTQQRCTAFGSSYSTIPQPLGGSMPVAGMPPEIRWFGCVCVGPSGMISLLRAIYSCLARRAQLRDLGLAQSGLRSSSDPASGSELCSLGPLVLVAGSHWQILPPLGLGIHLRSMRAAHSGTREPGTPWLTKGRCAWLPGEVTYAILQSQSNTKCRFPCGASSYEETPNPTLGYDRFPGGGGGGIYNAMWCCIEATGPRRDREATAKRCVSGCCARRSRAPRCPASNSPGIGIGIVLILV
jgi:hypothetical protein